MNRSAWECDESGSSMKFCFFFITHTHTVMFEIELINFVDHSAADEYAILSKDEKKQATLDQLIAVANAEREVHI